MIELDTLKSLIQLMIDNGLSELDLRDGDQTVALKRGGMSPVAGAPAMNPGESAAAGADNAAAAPAVEDESLEKIASPMVGTFYARPKPDQPLFVQVGDKVTPDTVVCLIEAMKVFTEVRAQCAGVIERVLVEDSEPVEFDQELFRVRPA